MGQSTAQAPMTIPRMMTETASAAVPTAASPTPAAEAADARAAWLAERRSGIGASEVAAIIGESPYASAWSVWVDKMGLVPLDLHDRATPAMEVGLYLEPLIARLFSDATGLCVAGEQTLVRHRRAPHHFATLDGYVLESPDESLDDAIGVFEAKYSAEAWDRLPDHYATQVQWQLHCTGLAHAWVAALQFPFGRPRFDVFEIERDKRHIDDLVAAVDSFWDDHVVTGIAPPADTHPATTVAIGAAWGGIETVREPTVELDEIAAVVEEFAARRTERSRLNKRLEFIENSLKAVFGGHDAHCSEGTVGGQLAVSWRSQTRTDIDVDAVRADHGDRYDRVRTVRVLRPHHRRQ